MGDLKPSEGFLDAVMIRVRSTGLAATGLSPTCTMTKVSDGTRTVLTVAELSYGIYKVTDMAPAADDEYLTEWAVSGAQTYDIYSAYKLFKVGGGRSEDIHELLHHQHQDVTILFIIPEALGVISAHNTAIQEQLDVLGTVVTITQADALTYPDYQMMGLIVIGTDQGVAAWNTANLADLKSHPGAPILFCDVTPAAFFEMGTDGGDAAAKTAISAVANIEASILGFGYKEVVGLAVGANTVSAAAIYQTLDMSDADITEIYYADESAGNNTDVVIGLIRRTRLDGSPGIDEEGNEVNQTMAFYGCAYSASSLNTLGLAVFHLLGHMLLMETALTIPTEVEVLFQKLFGNVRGKLSNTSPLAAFIAGNSGGLGTELPNNVSIYDVVMYLFLIAHPTGDPTADSLIDLIMNKGAGQTFNRATDSLEFLGEIAADILTDVTGINGDAMRGTDSAALASAWTAVLATILGNFTALRIGYLDELDFDLNAAIADLPTNAEAEALVENAVDSGDSTHEITQADDQNNIEVFEVAKAGIYALSVFFDLDVLETAGEGGIVTIRLYNKIDGTNYSDHPTAKIDYVVGVTLEYPSIEANMLHGYSQVKIQCSDDLGANRTIAYRYIVRDLGT